MMKSLLKSLVAVSLFLGSPVFAHEGHEKCHCTQDCAKECKEGKGQKCKCDHCGCAHGKVCNSGKCSHEHKHEGEPRGKKSEHQAESQSEKHAAKSTLNKE